MFNISMNTLKPFFVGFLLGILVIAGGLGIFAKTVYDDTVTNYGDEATTLVSMLEEAKDPALQKDYIITGLILSDDFNEFLEEGVETGVWTEDFLIQFAGDYSLPILIGHYADLIGAIASTDQAKEIAEIVSKIMDMVVKIKLQLKVVGPQIQSLIQMLKDPELKDKALEMIKEKVLTVLENAGVLDVLANIINKVDVIKFKVKGTVDSFMRLLDTLKDTDIRAELITKVKALVSDKIAELGLTEKLANLKSGIISTIEEVLGTKISQLKPLIIEKLAEVTGKTVAQVKSILADKLAEAKGSIIGLILGLKDDVLAQLLVALSGVKEELVAKIAGLSTKVKAEILARLASVKAELLLKLAGVKDEVIAKIVATVKAKIANLDLEGNIEDLKAMILVYLTTAISTLTDEAKAKLELIIQDLLSTLDLDAIKAAIISEVLSHKDEIVSEILSHKDEIIEALVNYIAANINLDAINIAINNIEAIIDRLHDLEEQMPEIKDQIEAIIANFNNLIDILNNIDFDDINATIEAIIEQIDEIFATIDEIAGVLGDASAVISVIVNTEDVEGDNWMFIPALKAYDDSLKLINLPTSVYKKLNLLEPIINILTLDIVYTYTPDDGNLLNGNTSTLDITAVNVGKEGNDKTVNAISSPINLGGVVADTVSGFLPIISNNI